jgi:hypothetical protein
VKTIATTNFSFIRQIFLHQGIQTTTIKNFFFQICNKHYKPTNETISFQKIICLPTIDPNNNNYNLIFLFCFVCTLVLVSWHASYSLFVMKLGFYKPTVLKVPLPISRITAHATRPGRLEHSMISFCFMLLIQINGAWKMVSTWSPEFKPTTCQSWVLCLNP